MILGAVVGRGLTKDSQVEALVHEHRPASRDGLPAHFERATGELQLNLRAGSPQTRAWNRSWLWMLGQLTGTEPDGTPHEDPDLAVLAVDGASEVGEPAATVSGAAADLDCWLWNRPPTGEVVRTGDPLVLERFDETMADARS